MMTRKYARGLIVALLFFVPNVSFAGTALGFKASSLGLGAELTSSLTDRVNVRFGGNFFSYKYSGNKDDIDYDFDLKLRSFSGVLDLYPFGGGFHLSGGFVANRSSLAAVGTSTGTYEIGNGTYTKGQVGTLTGAIDLKKGAPYAGIGFGNPVGSGKHLSVTLDAGVIFQGAPTVALVATGPIASNSQFQNDLRMEQQNLQDDLKVFKYYPVIALGVSFKF